MANIRNYESKYLAENLDSYLLHLIEALDAKRICDIGGGRNPKLTLDFVNSNAIEYTVLDISQKELDHAPSEYSKICKDIGSKNFDVVQQFDFVFSRMVAEHIIDGEQFHRNVFQMLKPGGIAFHYFPTLYSLPFLVNRIIPEWLSDSILRLLLPRDRKQYGKFPAYYSWTYGPTKSQLSRLEGLGFDVARYIAGFGHSYYRHIPVVRNVARMLSRRLMKKENYLLCSFAYLVVRRPDLNADGTDLTELPWP